MFKQVTLIITSLFLVLALTQSCKNDECDDVNCLNAGTCDDGKCICTSEYSGVNCETLIDLCAPINCLNNGICIDGICDCPNGFSGDSCQIEPPCLNIMAKF